MHRLLHSFATENLVENEALPLGLTPQTCVFVAYMKLISQLISVLFNLHEHAGVIPMELCSLLKLRKLGLSRNTFLG